MSFTLGALGALLLMLAPGAEQGLMARPLPQEPLAKCRGGNPRSDQSRLISLPIDTGGNLVGVHSKA